MPGSALTLLRTIVGKYGWDGSPFTESSLASRKLYPGYVFRCTTEKTWSDRCRVSVASCVLMLENISHDADTLPDALRRNYDVKRLEARAEQAAFVQWVRDDLINNYALPAGIVDLEFVNGFRRVFQKKNCFLFCSLLYRVSVSWMAEYENSSWRIWLEPPGFVFSISESGCCSLSTVLYAACIPASPSRNTVG